MTEEPLDEIDRAHLHHVHLPMLADTGIVKYDPWSTTVKYHGHPGLEPLLESTTTIESTLATE